jgi:hypothetical protein
VGYEVSVHPLVEEYLSRTDVVSDEARVKLAEALVSDLENAGDQFRKHNRRVRPGSPCFWYDRLFRDRGQLQHFWFAVSDASAAAGVLIVGFAERRP